jgi:hypothetical protein
MGQGKIEGTCSIEIFTSKADLIAAAVRSCSFWTVGPTSVRYNFAFLKLHLTST